MSLDSLTIHFRSFHPLGCPDRLVELPVAEVEGLVSGTKLESAGSRPVSEVMLASNNDEVALVSIAVAPVRCGSWCTGMTLKKCINIVARKRTY